MQALEHVAEEKTTRAGRNDRNTGSAKSEQKAPAVMLQGLHKSFDGKPVLNGIDLKIEQKDRVRFARQVAFFATVGCAWDWDRPFRFARRVGNIGNHHRIRMPCPFVATCFVERSPRCIESGALAFTLTATRPYDGRSPVEGMQALSIFEVISETRMAAHWRS